MMGHYGWYGVSWLGMILGPILFIAFLVGVVALVVWAVRRVSDSSNRIASSSAAGSSAKEFAQMRYARGEISREEYQQILADLTG